MKICFLFPGQGAQYPGMGKDLWETSEKVKNLFKLASDATEIDMETLLFNSTEEELKATDKTQIAVTLVNLSACTVLKERGFNPDGIAGFSLGEYAALCEAGIIKIDDIFPIVKIRGSLMEKASRNLDSDSGNPGMVAVIGLEIKKMEEILEKEKLEGIYLANYNSPGQIVISGTHEGLNNAEPVLMEAGARRFIRLKVSGPFHSPLLEEAKEGLKSTLGQYEFADPEKPVYSNVTGKLIKTGTEAKELCIKQVVSTVRWVDEEASIIKDGFDKFIETGPGSVLTGLLKRYTKDYPCFPAGKIEDIENIKL